MQITSTFLPPEVLGITGGSPTVLMAFDTLVDEQRNIVGITVGRVQGPHLADVRVSALGQCIIDRCTRFLAQHHPQGTVVVAGVASITGAKQRLCDVLAKAPPNAFVLLVCADDKVYDAVFPALGVNLQSANV